MDAGEEASEFDGDWVQMIHRLMAQRSFGRDDDDEEDDDDVGYVGHGTIYGHGDDEGDHDDADDDEDADDLFARSWAVEEASSPAFYRFFF